MAIFFFVVGLEIKRELVEGELREPRRAALPAIAAVGGMVVPAPDLRRVQRRRRRRRRAGASRWPPTSPWPSACSACSARGSSRRSSCSCSPSPSSTTSARSSSSPSSTPTTSTSPSLAAAPPSSSVPSAVARRARRPARSLVYVALGAGALARPPRVGRPRHASPASCSACWRRRARSAAAELIDADELADVSTSSTPATRSIVARQSVSVVEWLEHLLHPWTSFVIVPLFALANAGVPVTSDALVAPRRRRRSPTASSSGSSSASWSASPRSRGCRAPRHRRAARRARRGAASSASARSPASASRCRCSSPAWPSTTAVAAGRGQDRHPRRLDDRRRRSASLILSGVGRRSARRSRGRAAKLTAVTYCLAMRLDAGLLFLSDTRTNAGVDNVGTYRKLHVIRPAPDRRVRAAVGRQPRHHPRGAARIDRDLATPTATTRAWRPSSTSSRPPSTSAG